MSRYRVKGSPGTAGDKQAVSAGQVRRILGTLKGRFEGQELSEALNAVWSSEDFISLSEADQEALLKEFVPVRETSVETESSEEMPAADRRGAAEFSTVEVAAVSTEQPVGSVPETATAKAIGPIIESVKEAPLAPKLIIQGRRDRELTPALISGFEQQVAAEVGRATEPGKRRKLLFFKYVLAVDERGGQPGIFEYRGQDFKGSGNYQLEKLKTGIVWPAGADASMSTDQDLQQRVLAFCDKLRASLDGPGLHGCRVYLDQNKNGGVQVPKWKCDFTVADSQEEKRRQIIEDQIAVGDQIWDKNDKTQKVDPAVMPANVYDQACRALAAGDKEYYKKPPFSTWLGRTKQVKREEIISKKLAELYREAVGQSSVGPEKAGEAVVAPEVPATAATSPTIEAAGKATPPDAEEESAAEEIETLPESLLAESGEIVANLLPVLLELEMDRYKADRPALATRLAKISLGILSDEHRAKEAKEVMTDGGFLQKLRVQAAWAVERWQDTEEFFQVHPRLDRSKIKLSDDGQTVISLEKSDRPAALKEALEPLIADALGDGAEATAANTIAGVLAESLRRLAGQGTGSLKYDAKSDQLVIEDFNAFKRLIADFVAKSSGSAQKRQ